MLTLPLSACRTVLDAERIGEDTEISGVGIDTRTLTPGMLYVAIVGERHDGHAFVAEAEQAGAVALLVHRSVESTLPQLVVDDTRVALGALARFWAGRYPVQTIGITGSNGKTTVKEITAAILAQLGPVLATRGNLNNDIGVPLTLLELTSEHRYAVIEMGANAPGEIAALAAIVRPDVAIISNIGPAHLDGFGDLDGVAAGKTELFAALAPDGYAVFNTDDDYAGTMRAASAHCRRREFGETSDADVRGVKGEPFTVDSRGTRLQARLALLGEHNRRNALAAVAAVQCIDVQNASIVAGLESVRAVAGRLEIKRTASGALLIDDSYNANPASARAALAVLAEQAGRRHLVLGDMGELGSDAASLHEGIGDAAREHGIDGLWTVGVLASHATRRWDETVPAGDTPAGDVAAGDLPAEGISVADAPSGDTPSADENSANVTRTSTGGHYADVESLVTVLRDALGSDDCVLVKGSRSAHMERVVKALQVADAFGTDDAPDTSDTSDTVDTVDTTDTTDTTDTSDAEPVVADIPLATDACGSADVSEAEGAGT